MNGPARLTKQLQNDIGRILRAVDLLKLGPKERAAIADLKQALVDAVVYSATYELSETPDEAKDNAKQAKKWLARVRRDILALSEHDIFSAIDVAQLSAQIDTIRESLK